MKLEAHLKEQTREQGEQLGTKLKEQSALLEAHLKEQTKEQGDLLEIKLKEQSEQLGLKLEEQSKKQSHKLQEVVKQLFQFSKVNCYITIDITWSVHFQYCSIIDNLNNCWACS